MVRKLILIIMIVLFVGVPCGTHAAVELDADDNGAIDIDKGGWNSVDGSYDGPITIGGTGDSWLELLNNTSLVDDITGKYGIRFSNGVLQQIVDGTPSSVQAANTITSFASPTTANPYTLTAANLYNAAVYYGATGEIDLDPLADGMAVIIYNTGAFTITIDPNGSEVIVRDGNPQTGGVSITLSSGAGNFVCLVSDGTYWVTKGTKGTLLEGT